MRMAMLVLALAFGRYALAQEGAKRPCTEAEAAQAEKEVDSLKTWEDVYQSYKRFSQCDDGAIGEGYSDAVGKLLSDEWGRLPRLANLTNRDRGFEHFVLKHIDESLADDTLLKISRHARSECPVSGKKLCALIADAASAR
jgi:hypothetical protein